MNTQLDEYLSPTAIIDSGHELVVKYARETVGNSTDPVAQAVKLFYAVRDPIRYDPYLPFYLPEHYRASNVLKLGRGFCVSKSSLLCALARSCGIPSRIGFATVRNHLATRQMIERLGTDVVVYHGFNEFYLEGKWVKATPTFNRDLCERHRVLPLEFNGREDSIFHQYNTENKKFMEYLAYHGTCADIPVASIIAVWNKAYGRERIEGWLNDLHDPEKKALLDFYKEDVV